MRPCAAEMATPSCKKRTRAATSSLDKTTATTCRCQPLSHRSPTIYITWRVSYTLVLPGKTTFEEALTSRLLSVEPTLRNRLSLWLATSSFEVSPSSGIILLPLHNRAALIPTTYAVTTIGSTQPPASFAHLSL